MIAFFCELYSFEEAFPRYIDQFLKIRSDLTDSMCPCSIGMITFVDQSGIDLDKIAFLDDLMSGRNPVYYFIIEADAE